MCNDGDICTVDICDIPAGSNKGTCKYEEKINCCLTPDDCAPKTCKNVYCQSGSCVYVEKENCCTHDSQCDDGNLNTIDRCVNSQCFHELIPGT